MKNSWYFEKKKNWISLAPWKIIFFQNSFEEVKTEEEIESKKKKKSS